MKFIKPTRFVNLFNTDVSMFTYVLLAYAVFNAFWLSSKGLISGQLYITMFFAAIGLVIYLQITKSENVFKFPIIFATKNNVAITRFYVGFIVMFLILSIFQGFAAYSVQSFQPLNSFRATQAEATFSALEAQNSPFWTMNTVVVFASVFEEVLIGFFVVFILFVSLSFFFKNKLNEMSILWLAIIIDVFIFIILHTFNATYTTPAMFAISGLFRLVGNIIIYIIGFGIEFMIGVHAANNAVFIGIDMFMSGLLSIGGIVLIMMNALFIYMLFVPPSNIKEGLVNLSYKWGGES